MSGRPEIEDVLALSPLQEGLFSLSKLTGTGVDLYAMQFVVDIDGPLNVSLLRDAAGTMLDRHPNLRVSFWDTDVPKPVQIVPTRVELPWSERAAEPGEFDAIAESQRRRPFDLGRGPAMRFLLLTVPDDPRRRRLVLTAHHILMDGWAMAVFFTELLAIYQAGGSTANLPRPRPYRDYIGWLAAQDTAAAVRGWAEYLGKLSGPLLLADGAGPRGRVPEKTRLSLPGADLDRLRRWARDHGLTLATVVQFAWTVLLGRLADRRDVVFGTTISGRPESLAGVERMVGLFINTVPIAHRLDRAVSVVDQCRRMQSEAAAMRDIGYPSLSTIQRTTEHPTLFDTLFVFENAPIGDAVQDTVTADGVRFHPVEMESPAHYPLTVVAHLGDDELVVLLEAIPEALPYLPAAETGERLLSILRQLPDIADAGPDALDILTPAERAAPLDVPEAPVDEANTTIWELFEQQVARTPDAVALTAGDGERYTYRRLHDAAVRLAAEFGEYGIGTESVVALALPRSTGCIVGLLAVLAAGGAYVPVDVTLPAARIASILRQARPALLVTTEEHRDLPVGHAGPTLVLDDPDSAERIARRSVELPSPHRHPAQPAYLIFTSGSTGEPKGVVGTNAAVAAYFADHRDRVYRPARARLGRPLRIAHAWSLSFDASWQPMVGLLAGQWIHLFDAEEMRDAHRLVKGMARHGIDMLDTTPSMFAQLAAAGLLDHAPTVLALGGEAIDTALWSRLRALPETAVYNCYGPTETTVEAVVAAVADTAEPTIGLPTAGTSGYVLDSALRPVPGGVVGELYLSGPQVTRGYIGRPAGTAERFVADPFRPGRRMYRTGDLVRRLDHGGFAYLGRADAQVKVRGYRIEVGEIETALRRLSDVDTAAVTVVRRAGGASLIGFVVPRDGRAADPARLRVALTDRLPAYMIPARIIVLDRLPVNANGKLDAHELNRLAEQTMTRSESTETGARTASEQVLSEVFAELFDGRPPGLDEDFFELGVDSIVAISLVARARRRGLMVNPRMVMAAPTIRELAAVVDAAAAAPPGDVQDGRDYGEVPPLPIVSWMYEYGRYRRFTQTTLLRLPAGITDERLETVLQAMLDGYDTLRSRLADTPDGPRLVTREPGTVRAADILLRRPPDAAADPAAAVREAARAAVDEIDPRTGEIVRAVRLTDGDGDILLLTIHHLAVDVVSWHILLVGLAEIWASVEAGGPIETVPEFTSYRQWSRRMTERAVEPEVLAQRGYWAAQLAGPDPAIGRRLPDPLVDDWSGLRVTSAAVDVAATERILAVLTRTEGVREFLLAALTMTLASRRVERGQDPTGGALIALEGHGRADELFGTDTTHTVGWFTSVFPVRLGAGPDTVDVARAEADPAAARALLDSVAAHLSAVPNGGLDYGLLRYVDRSPGLVDAPEPQVEFNYLGRMDLGGHEDGPWSMLAGGLDTALPLDPEPDLPLRYALDVIAGIGSTPDGPLLHTNWRWSEALFTESDAEHLAALWRRAVTALAAALEYRDRDGDKTNGRAVG